MSKRSKKTPKTRKPAKATTSEVEPDAVPDAQVERDTAPEPVDQPAPEVEMPTEASVPAELPADEAGETIDDETQKIMEIQAELDASIEPTTEKVEEAPALEVAPEATGAPATTETVDATDNAAPETPAASEAAPAKPKKEAEPKKLSALDAAAQVLKAAGQPMTCPEMIEAMSKQGLWSSPNGSTPVATLYSAILRELKKGEASRFQKADRGKFTAKAS